MSEKGKGPVGDGTMEIKETARKYTYDDYASWDDGERYEVIEGRVYAMTMPTVKHQSVSGRLYTQLGTFLEGKKCEVFHPPFDVILDNKNVFQPDILIVCDKSKLDPKKGCIGAPDMVVEILSPSSVGRDMLLKLKKYLQAGVREYWIIDPENEIVYVNILENKQYDIREYKEKEMVPVSILDGFEIDLKRVFAD
jgi:Uma2 family endonuclease